MQQLTAVKLEKALYTTSKPDDSSHTTVVAFTKKFAVSFRHGPHLMFEKEEKIILYNVEDPSIQLEAVVHAISDVYDLVVFKLLKEEFTSYPHDLASTYRSQIYQQLGVNQQRKPTWKDGTISEKYLGFLVGSSPAKCGVSGFGIFDFAGRFLGISIAQKNFFFTDPQNMSIAEVAEHHSDTKIIDSITITAVSGIIDPDPFNPPEKKHETDSK